MSTDKLKRQVETMLGGSGEGAVYIELDNADFDEIEKKALSVVSPYITGRRYVVSTKETTDLSIHDPVEIVKVWETSDSVLMSAEDFAFGGQNIIIYNSDFTERYASYLAYKMLYNEYQNLKSRSWKYVNKVLYVHGFRGQILIEMIVRPRSISEVEDRSEFYPWIESYCLALAKEVVGRKRSKYIVEGSPYVLDGNVLLAEGLKEQEDLEARLTSMGGIFVL